MSMDRVDYIMVGTDITEYWNKLDENVAWNLFNKYQCSHVYLDIIQDQSSDDKPVIVGKVLFSIYEDDLSEDEIIDLDIVHEMIIKVKEQIKNDFNIDCEPKLRIVTTWS